MSAPRERKNLEKALAIVATREEKVVTAAMKASFWLCTENLPVAKFPSLLKLLRILQIPDIDALTLLKNIMSEITFLSTRWPILGSFVANVVLCAAIYRIREPCIEPVFEDLYLAFQSRFALPI